MAEPGFHDKYAFVKRVDPATGTQYFPCCGSGGFGAVFECVDKTRPDVTLAVKVIQTSDAAAAKMFDSEVRKMKDLRASILADEEAARTIIVLHDGYKEIAPHGGLIIRLVMEKSPLSRPFPFAATPAEVEPNAHTMRTMRSEGSQCDLTFNSIASPPLTLTQARHVMRQLLVAIRFFHSQGLIHRDIKPDNMLVWGAAHDPVTGEIYPLIKLSDFGLARAVDPLAETYTRNIGTRSYRAPELKSGRYNSSIDLFAAGCTFFALMLAEQPSDRVDVGFPDRFQHISPHRLLATFPFESPQLHFLAMLTQADPACRLTAEQALAHPFITGVMPAAAGAPAAAAPAPVGGAGASGI